MLIQHTHTHTHTHTYTHTYTDTHTHAHKKVIENHFYFITNIFITEKGQHTFKQI